MAHRAVSRAVEYIEYAGWCQRHGVALDSLMALRYRYAHAPVQGPPSPYTVVDTGYASVTVGLDYDNEGNGTAVLLGVVEDGLDEATCWLEVAQARAIVAALQDALERLDAAQR